MESVDGLLTQATQPARVGRVLARTGMVAAGLCLSFAVAAAPPPPPPLPPPLPSAAQPGGAQPVMPPPTIPIPMSNLDLTVPPVYERPLGAEEGERVFVKRFVVTGVVGDRKAGIDPKEIERQVDEVFASIQKILEQERLTKENLEKQGPDGFTPEEHDKIIKFMQGAVKTASPEDQQKEYQNFIHDLMLERLTRLQGLTIGQLQRVADAVTQYYHDKGYFLARAVIPAQEITDGVVNVHVLEGRLEKVTTAGNKLYSDKTLSRPFTPLLGQLVTIGRTENALLTLTKYPGLSAAGVFRPGSDIGATDIVVNVQSERRFDGLVRVDNDGTAFTGRDRLVGTVNWNDPTGASDLLSVTAVKTATCGSSSSGGASCDSTFGEIRYDHPFFDAYDRWAMDVSRNTFDVGALANAKIGGISKIGSFSVEHDFFRSRTSNLIGTADLSRKRADTLTLGTITGRDDLAELGLQLSYDSINQSTNIISTYLLRYEKGFGGVLGVPTDSQVNAKNFSPPVGRSGTKPSFSKWMINYQLYKNLPLNQGLLFRVSGQYTSDRLSSLEEMGLGGSDSVRAVPMSQFLVDKGAFTSLEYSVAAPGFYDKHAFGTYSWGQVLRFKLFTDTARGFYNHAVATENTRNITGSGVGVEFSIPGTMTANLAWAHLNGGARLGVAGDPNAIKQSSETWLDVTVNF